MRHSTIYITLSLATFLASACSDNGEGGGMTAPEPRNAELRAGIVANIGTNIILPTYQAFSEATNGLAAATLAYANTLSPTDLEAARTAWKNAMNVWQQAEMFQIGPAAVMGVAAGGQDLRDKIYSWPLLNPCRIDQLTVDQTYASIETLSGERINVRGLDTLEYLVFSEGVDNSCPAQLPINAEGQWSAVGTEGIQKRRAEYAANAAAVLQKDAADLKLAWEASGGNFIVHLTSPGQAGGEAVYPNAQAALNAISDGMFYLDKETKDMKFAIPAGLSPTCETETCPEALESRLSGHSKANALVNVKTFGLLFLAGETPNDGDGFDDLLTQIGAPEVASTMMTAHDNAVAAIEAIEDPMDQTLLTDRSSLIAAYEALKVLTDELKSTFVTVLDLEPPDRAVGDND